MHINLPFNNLYNEKKIKEERKASERKIKEIQILGGRKHSNYIMMFI